MSVKKEELKWTCSRITVKCAVEIALRPTRIDRVRVESASQVAKDDLHQGHGDARGNRSREGPQHEAVLALGAIGQDPPVVAQWRLFLLLRLLLVILVWLRLLLLSGSRGLVI